MNSTNSYVISGSTSLNQNEETVLTISNLVIGTNYTLHAIGASSYPGYPDLMNGTNDTLRINFVTVLT